MSLPLPSLDQLQPAEFDAGELFSGETSGRMVKGYKSPCLHTPIWDPHYLWRRQPRCGGDLPRLPPPVRLLPARRGLPEVPWPVCRGSSSRSGSGRPHRSQGPSLNLGRRDRRTGGADTPVLPLVGEPYAVAPFRPLPLQNHPRAGAENPRSEQTPLGTRQPFRRSWRDGPARASGG